MSSVEESRDAVHESWNLFDEPASDELPWECEPDAGGSTEGVEPAAGALPFAEWVDACAGYYRSEGTSAGRWLAKELGALASLARALHADGPDPFDARRAALDGDAGEKAYGRGYRDGLRDGQRIASRPLCGLD